MTKYDIDYKSTDDKTVYRHRKCLVCGEMFDVTLSDKKWCRLINRDYPTWCNKCRGLHHIEIMERRLRDGK